MARLQRREAPAANVAAHEPRRDARCRCVVVLVDAVECAAGAAPHGEPRQPGQSWPLRRPSTPAAQPACSSPANRSGRGGGAARGDGGIPKAATQGLHPHRTTAWHVLPAYPRRCHYEGDRRTRRETLQSARCAPASRQDVQNVQKTFSKL